MIMTRRNFAARYQAAITTVAGWIQAGMPTANLRDADAWGKEHRDRPGHNAVAVRCIQTGEVFPTIRAAARRYKVSVTAMSYHVNGDRLIK